MCETHMRRRERAQKLEHANEKPRAAAASVRALARREHAGAPFFSRLLDLLRNKVYKVPQRLALARQVLEPLAVQHGHEEQQLAEGGLICVKQNLDLSGMG